MKIRLRVIVLLAALFGLGQLCVDSQTLDFRSAKGLHARVIAIGKTRESRVEIKSSHGKLIRSKSFVSLDGEHGQVVRHAKWTSNADFFVFDTTKTGGHQPWSRETYLYS